MRNTTFSVIAAMLIAAPALAQGALAPKEGQMVKTADGQAVGRIDEVQTSGGQPVSVSIIYNEHFIHIPASTLSPGDKGLVTSMSRKDVSQLN